MRVTLENHSRIGAVTTAVGDAGGAVTALDVVDPNGAGMTIDLTCNAVDEGHSELLRAAVEVVDGARVIAMSDRTFLLHLGSRRVTTSRWRTRRAWRASRWRSPRTRRPRAS
jgi:malate dehydrogenase (oxaloacetate-decarboxylating)